MSFAPGAEKLYCKKCLAIYHKERFNNESALPASSNDEASDDTHNSRIDPPCQVTNWQARMPN